jgi:Domain of unknown function (DUF4389)
VDQTTVPSNEKLGLGARILYTILFGFVFWILCWALAITTIAQLAVSLFTQRKSADLTRFGAGLATYAKQVIEFLTCNSDALPFPFSSWPDVPTRIQPEDVEHL